MGINGYHGFRMCGCVQNAKAPIGIYPKRKRVFRRKLRPHETVLMSITPGELFRLVKEDV